MTDLSRSTGRLLAGALAACLALWAVAPGEADAQRRHGRLARAARLRRTQQAAALAAQQPHVNTGALAPGGACATTGGG